MFAKAKVDNSIYKDFGERWYHSNDYIALLRQESKVRNAWVIDKIKTNILNSQEDSGNKSPKILDVGCGAGFLSNDLGQQGFDVTGIDIYEETLKVARAYDKTKRVNYLKADALSLPFENGSFDILCMMDFIEHIEDVPSLLKECSRVLKKDGVVFFHTFNRNPVSWFIAIKCVEWFIKDTPKNLHVYNLFIKPQELIDLFKELGFEKQDLVGLGPVLTPKSIYEILVKGEVNENFHFKIRSSLLIGYLGYVKKQT